MRSRRYISSTSLYLNVIEAEQGLKSFFVQVYRGIDTLLNKPVAIKFMARAGRTGSETLTKLHDFLSEVKHLRMLEHPSIMKIITAFATDESFCIVSNLADGKPHCRLQAVLGHHLTYVAWSA